MYALIDIGGTYIRIAELENINNTDSNTVETLPIENVYENDLNTIVRFLEEYKGKLKGIVICIPGILDITEGRVIFSPNLQSWNGRNIVNDLENIFHSPIFMINDAVAGALGSVSLYNTVNDFLYINWGTGIGGTLVRTSCNKKILTPIEPGHHIMDINGPQCTCGRKGCLEAIINNIDIGNKDNHNEIIQYFSIGLMNIISINKISTIVLGGGVVHHYNNLLQDLENYINKQKWLGPKIRIIPVPLEINIIGLKY
ncbi:MAG TPA: ROK family protein, partial [Candidatus Paceibacterota bacterium]